MRALTMLSTHQQILPLLKLIQSFLYTSFDNYKDDEKIRPVSKKSARLYGTAKTHKSEHPGDIGQTGTYIYNAVQVVSVYLKHTAKITIQLVKLN